jgi:DNA polymerase-4
MDAFFASVEQRDDPRLRGRPVLVGHAGPRGVVAAASYEARAFGCHSAQPMEVARRLCPKAIIVPNRGGHYREASRQVFAVFEEITPLVEPLSIDEAFLDITGSLALFGPPREVAERIRRRIREATRLTASVGVAPNKFLAKLASDMDKPDGLTVIEPERVREILDPLPIGRMWGVGPATEARLRALGIHTFADLAAVPLAALQSRVGSLAERIHQLARGVDDRPVVPDHEAKSIGHEQTFGADLRHPDAVRQVLAGQAEQVAARLRRHGFRARTVTVKIRYGNFETITRSTTLAVATDHTDQLWKAARGLFDQWAAKSYRPVRLIGVAASHFRAPEPQLTLFEDPREKRMSRVDHVTDAIEGKFGKGAIQRGASLRRRDPSSSKT